MLAVQPLVLASGSPRRAELLRSASVTFVQRSGACDETPLAGEHPVALARRLAEAKARACPVPGHVRLGADTVVWRTPAAVAIGKPDDRRHAIEILRELAGGMHLVTTGWALVDDDGVEVHDVTTRVFMRPLGDDEIERYVAGDEWRDKAGGYGIQGAAAGFVTHIEGSYTNVVGLPLAEVVVRLRARGNA